MPSSSHSDAAERLYPGASFQPGPRSLADAVAPDAAQRPDRPTSGAGHDCEAASCGAGGQAWPANPVRVVIAGQTASGKSRLALDLIEALGEGAGTSRPAAVVNADASQLYRGMDIGTAKLPVVQRRGIEHLQLDVLDVREEASVAAYQASARADIARLGPAGRRAVIVGGSGLYVRALTDELVFPGTDRQLRAALTRRLEREGARRLWEELAQADPVSAERIEAANTRRVVRALEVIELTGRPFSATMPRYEDQVPTVHVAIRAVGRDGPLSFEDGRHGLVARIQARARAMFDAGLLEETAELERSGLRQGPTASRAIGYSQALAVLGGDMNVPEAIAATSLATRQLAARQLKWFRRDPRIHWLTLPTGPDGSIREGDWQELVSDAVALVRHAEREQGHGRGRAGTD